MAFSPFSPQPTPQMPTKRQYGLLGGEQSGAIAKGFGKAEEVFKNYDEMLTKRAEARRLQAIEARNMAMKEETHKLNQATGELANKNAEAKEGRDVTTFDRGVDVQTKMDAIVKGYMDKGEDLNQPDAYQKFSSQLAGTGATGEQIKKMTDVYDYLFKEKNKRFAPVSGSGKPEPTETQVQAVLDQIESDMAGIDAEIAAINKTPLGKTVLNPITGKPISIPDEIGKRMMLGEANKRKQTFHTERIKWTGKLKNPLQPRNSKDKTERIRQLREENQLIRQTLGE